MHVRQNPIPISFGGLSTAKHDLLGLCALRQPRDSAALMGLDYALMTPD